VIRTMSPYYWWFVLCLLTIGDSYYVSLLLVIRTMSSY